MGLFFFFCQILFSYIWTMAYYLHLLHSTLPGSSVDVILQAICFFKESFQPRDRTLFSCISGRCFTIWATKEAP